MTAFNKSRPRPAWLDREHANKNTQRGQKYYRHLWNAQPPWADVAAIRGIYNEARSLRRAGYDVEVDHIVPLIHPLVCGLHVRANLRIIDRRINAQKSNHTFPGMPFRQFDLFERSIAPADFYLQIQEPR